MKKILIISFSIVFITVLLLNPAMTHAKVDSDIGDEEGIYETESTNIEHEDLTEGQETFSDTEVESDESEGEENETEDPPLEFQTELEANIEEQIEIEYHEEATPVFSNNDNGSYTTTENVVENMDYIFPDDSRIKIQFTNVTEEGTITINKIYLTEEEIEGLGSIYDYGIEITSTMSNGSFVYNLTLPNAQDGSDIKYSEDGEIFYEINNETVDENKIVAESVDHFTIFIITDDDATYTGNWNDNPTGGFINNGHHEQTDLLAGNQATWGFSSVSDGEYNVYISWVTNITGSPDAAYSLNHTQGTYDFTIDQTLLADQATAGNNGDFSGWYFVGTYTLNSTSTLTLTTVTAIEEEDFITADEVLLMGAPDPLGFNSPNLSANANSTPLNVSCGGTTDQNSYAFNFSNNIQAGITNMYEIEITDPYGNTSTILVTNIFTTFQSFNNIQGIWSFRARVFDDGNLSLLHDPTEPISPWGSTCTVTYETPDLLVQTGYDMYLPSVVGFLMLIIVGLLHVKIHFSLKYLTPVFEGGISKRISFPKLIIKTKKPPGRFRFIKEFSCKRQRK